MATTTYDCEGPCCCRCHFFKTIGYYNKADVVIPSPTGYSGMAASPAFRLSIVLGVGGTQSYTLQMETATGSPPTNTAPTYATEPLFGSEGGTGNCRWSYYDYDAAQNIVTYIVAIDDGTDFIILTQYYVFADGSYPFDTNVFEYWGNIPISQPGAFTSTTLSNLAAGSGHVFYVPATDAEIAPSGDATWFQCGTNEDGTLVEEEEAPMMMASSRTLPMARPDRCDHFTGRTEFRPGCGGWKCRGGCALGLPAVPGIACQSCESYAADPDYAGQGPTGWNK